VSLGRQRGWHPSGSAWRDYPPTGQVRAPLSSAPYYAFEGGGVNNVLGSIYEKCLPNGLFVKKIHKGQDKKLHRFLSNAKARPSPSSLEPRCVGAKPAVQSSTPQKTPIPFEFVEPLVDSGSPLGPGHGGRPRSPARRWCE
jgi:hypothetical protein